MPHHWPDETTPHEENLGCFLISLHSMAEKIRALWHVKSDAMQLCFNNRLSSSQKNQCTSLSGLLQLPSIIYMIVGRFEEQLKPICLEHEIGVVSYYSLASGFLSGNIAV